MSTIYRPTSVLLDKSVVRETLRGLDRIRRGYPIADLPDRQRSSLAAIVAALEQGASLLITEQLHHILLQPYAFHVARALMPRLHVLVKGRYLKRWARRLREEGFSPEDAMLLSHGSFGLNRVVETFGAEALLTTDYALQARYERNFARIDERFDRMTRQLVVPYAEAKLPNVLRPEELLGALQG